MTYEANQIYHIYNQGNNQQPIFFERENYLFFLRKMRKHLLPHADVLCYCLMPNHFHWLVVVRQEGVALGNKPKAQPVFQKNSSIDHRQQLLSQHIGTLLSGYTKAINKRYHRSGSLFRGRTKVKDGWIDDFVALEGAHRDYFFRADNDYARQCFRYIHQNPVKAGLVRRAIDWEFSSAVDYAGLRQGTLCHQELAHALDLIN
jgi:putative transposase